jgi:antitoxin (DNA-binding transcriptional repressor) of toxin-antitoxin stability system
MDRVITATALARQLGDVLGRIRYRGDSFVVERNGVAIARIVPVAKEPRRKLVEALRRWKGAGAADPDFAGDLERVGASDREPGDPWAS